MRFSEDAQELLERLWLAAEDGSEQLAVTDPISESMDELSRSGLVIQNGLFWKLTDSGHPEAAQAIRRHRLGERLLADVLKAEDVSLDEQACRLEHVLFDGLDESICTLLGHPQFCPHGKPIPPGDCCRQMRESVGRLIAPLSELEEGQGGEVAYIQMSDAGRLQKLIAMGVLPGGKISLQRRSPSFVFECGYSQFAVDEEIAADVYVRLTQTSEVG
ncbi:Iron-dependent repressor IdeR [Anaerolineales bacterium]|nr:Iron-dependent repressor IdeR [Anaerolineales bacterium]